MVSDRNREDFNFGPREEVKVSPSEQNENPWVTKEEIEVQFTEKDDEGSKVFYFLILIPLLI